VRFLRGLDQGIAKKVDLQPYWSFEDVCKLAIKVERYSKNKKPFTNSYSHPNPPPKPYTSLKPYSAPTPETQAKIDPAKDKDKELLKSFLSNLMARGASSVNSMVISKQSVQTEELSP